MAPEIRDFIILLVNIFNDVIILYFFVGNGIYTTLMLISFVTVWLYQKRVTYAGLQEAKRRCRGTVWETPGMRRGWEQAIMRDDFRKAPEWVRAGA